MKNFSPLAAPVKMALVILSAAVDTGPVMPEAVLPVPPMNTFVGLPSVFSPSELVGTTPPPVLVASGDQVVVAGDCRIRLASPLAVPSPKALVLLLIDGSITSVLVVGMPKAGMKLSAPLPRL